LKTINSISLPNLTNTANVGGLFSGCSALTTIGTLDLQALFAQNANIFSGCSALKTIGTLNISKLTNSSYMFRGLQSLEAINNMITTSVSMNNANYMFADCPKFTTLPSNFDASTIGTANSMFENCTSFNIDISKYNWSNMTSCTSMLKYCTSLNSISSISLPKVVTPGSMFWGTKITKMTGFNAPLATDLNGIFRECSALTTVSNINTPKNKALAMGFWNCTNLTTISNLDSSVLGDTGNTFYNCTKLTSITFTGSATPKSIDITNSGFNSTGLTNLISNLINRPNKDGVIAIKGTTAATNLTQTQIDNAEAKGYTIKTT
jgi:hypothetical protein